MSDARHPKVLQKPVLPPSLEEIDNFNAETNRYMAGEFNPDDYRQFRLLHGTYGQRQPDNQMIRVKLPFGGATAEQFEVFAEIAERYSGVGRGHITTRQNFQFHFIPLETVSTIMNNLAEVGLTTREACSNTVRNVTACPYAGVARGEVFDVSPYAAAYARHFLRNPRNTNLPRKWKTAFSGCTENGHTKHADCAMTALHDLGFLAKTQVIDGKEVRGFQIVVGGGTSTMARKAEVIYDFEPAPEYIVKSSAIIEVFNRYGERRNRNQARVKWLVRKIGFEEFKRRVAEELNDPYYAELRTSLAERWDELTDIDTEGVGDLVPLEGLLPAGYAEWRLSNVQPQRQRGLFAVAVTVPMGDFSPEQFRQVADLMRKYSGGRLRTTIQQNVLLRHVQEGSLPALYADLAAIGLGDAGAGAITDVVSCPGTDSCSLAIASSRGLARAMNRTSRELPQITDALTNQITIKMSGCPNGCGQHHIAAIGFSGAATKHHGREVPSAELWLGGGVTDQGFRYGKLVGKIPTKNTPQLLDRLLTIYQEKRNDGEVFQDFVERFGAKELGALALKGITTVATPEEDPSAYMDWDQLRPYTVERGEGECAV